MLRAASIPALAALALLAAAPLHAQQTAAPVQLPFHLQDNLIRVPATLNGQRIDAVLDSGTGGIAIDHAFAESLHLDIGAPVGMVPGGGKPVPMDPVILDHLDFGPEHLSFAPAIAVDLTVALTHNVGFLEKGQADGTLGVPLWQSGVVTFDYAHSSVCFELPK